MEILAHTLGAFASLCFIIQYIPQALLVWRKGSVMGFSDTSIIIKFIGASFLLINTSLTHEATVVIAYAFFNVLQFTYYRQNRTYLLWLWVPMLALVVGTISPESIDLTNLVKPMAQLASHLPQLVVCIKTKYTGGVSMTTQHLNILGGVAGLGMCLLVPPVNRTTIVMYINSCFQALSLYGVAYLYRANTATLDARRHWSVGVIEA